MIFRSCNLPTFPIICGYFGNIFKTAFVSLNHNFTHDFRFKIRFCVHFLHFMGFVLFSRTFFAHDKYVFADQIRFISPAASNPACKNETNPQTDRSADSFYPYTFAELSLPEELSTSRQFSRYSFGVQPYFNLNLFAKYCGEE